MPDRRDRLEGLLFGAFLGDAIALGPHWIYDPMRLRAEFGSIQGITPPPPDSYHVGKKFGDWTHYGDQTLMLLRYLREKRAFDERDFLERFRTFMAGYQGYKDHATNETLENLRAGRTEGSLSDELGGAARMAAPMYVFGDDPERAVAVAVAQCKSTHRDPLLLEVAELLAETAVRALEGIDPYRVLEALAVRRGGEMRALFEKAKETFGEDADTAAKKLGQSCGVRHAFPLTVYLLHRYDRDPRATLTGNAEAGGDSAARGMVLGALLGAHAGLGGLPGPLLRLMNGYGELDRIAVR